MLRRFVTVSIVLILSFVILFISITQTAQVKYSFNTPSNMQYANVLGDTDVVEYYFPYPGRVLPDHPLWPVKALRDRAWLLITPKAQRRAELNLLLANKRLVSSRILFERDKPELAYSTLTKAEKYIETALNEEEIARSSGVDTKSFLLSIAKASLKHREEIKEIMQIAPDDAKPLINKTEDSAKKIFQSVAEVFDKVGMKVPNDPFNGN